MQQPQSTKAQHNTGEEGSICTVFNWQGSLFEDGDDHSLGREDLQL